jgi:hypothetical protein
METVRAWEELLVCILRSNVLLSVLALLLMPDTGSFAFAPALDGLDLVRMGVGFT